MIAKHKVRFLKNETEHYEHYPSANYLLFLMYQ